ncbi:hypothetical protein SporoP8_13920 [Sporosarcina ureae]|uniref:helix-turn-helix domain-containing protein n=1 Tax=Sporosarcina ureae TaxID=1571 RepID=UPI000A15D5A9|nr:helix-turn-helix transcriptional regulator [Sporosarcina ureae]ARJ39877.1 hypothetical protein SporoP8_13920 [Sporosarcina ureae]
MNNAKNDFKTIRTFHELNQEQYAELIGISQGYVTLVENGRRRFTEDLRERVMRELRLTPDKLERILAIQAGYDAARATMLNQSNTTRPS